MAKGRVDIDAAKRQTAQPVNHDGLTQAEAAVIALGNTKKELLALLLVEMRINNEYNRRSQKYEVTARDLGNGTEDLLT